MRINPDFGCHANTRFSPANFTFEMLNSNIDGFSELRSYEIVFAVEKPVCNAGS